MALRDVRGPAGLQSWGAGAPVAGSLSSFLETCRLLLPSDIQVVAVQLKGKENLNFVQREGMLQLGKWKIELSRRNLVLTVPVCSQTVNRDLSEAPGARRPLGKINKTRQAKQNKQTKREVRKAEVWLNFMSHD